MSKLSSKGFRLKDAILGPSDHRMSVWRSWNRYLWVGTERRDIKGKTDPELGLDWVIGGEGRDRGVDWGVEADSGNDGERELDRVPNWDVGKEHDWEAEITVGIGICEVGGEVGLVAKDWKG